MSKKVFIGVGHGGNDAGAVKYLVEKDINLKMAKACADYLKAAGIEVKMSRTKDENDDISEEIKECNAFAPDLAVDVHNNAGGGDGFEVLCTVNGGKGKTLAQNIETEVKNIGQNSRGIKTKRNSAGTDYFGFIRCTKCPAVIVEGVFVDNKKDAAQADTDEECKAFGEAYAKGIMKTLGISQKEYKVKVLKESLPIRKGPKKEAKKVGTINDKGVYTIVDSKNGYGKLKSGKGWIWLDCTKRV